MMSSRGKASSTRLLNQFNRTINYIFHQDGFVSSNYFCWAIKYYPELALKAKTKLEEKIEKIEKTENELSKQMFEYVANEYNDSVLFLKKANKLFKETNNHSTVENLNRFKFIKTKKFSTIEDMKKRPKI